MKWSRCVIVLIVGEILRIKANGVQLTDIAFKGDDFAFKFFKRSYNKGKQARFRQVTVELSNVCQVDLKQKDPDPVVGTRKLTFVGETPTSSSLLAISANPGFDLSM